MQAAAALSACSDGGTRAWKAEMICFDGDVGGVGERHRPWQPAEMEARVCGRQQRVASTAVAATCTGSSGLGGLR